jgi:hypothetical protein
LNNIIIIECPKKILYSKVPWSVTIQSCRETIDQVFDITHIFNFFQKCEILKSLKETMFLSGNLRELVVRYQLFREGLQPGR